MLPKRSFVRLQVAMETVVSSSDNESINDDVDEQVDEEHETSQTTSMLSSAGNFCENLSGMKRQPHSVVWKFFLQVSKKLSTRRQYYSFKYSIQS